MQEIEQKAIQTYQENIKYLKKNHLELHQEVASLEADIGSGKYPERYALEYKNEGYFDVKNLLNGQWLYDENSKIYSKKMLDLINFKKDTSVFYGFQEREISQNDANIINQTLPHFNNSLWATATMISYHNQIAGNFTTLKDMFKLMFIDIGLGIHLEEIISKTNAKIIYIQDSDLELFRLSLFVTDYSKIAKMTKLFLAISKDESEIKNTFLAFLSEGFNYNLYLKYLPFYSEYKLELRTLQSITKQQSFIDYPYNATLIRDTLSPQYLFKNYKFLNINSKDTLSSISELPVLIVASGPSTRKEIEWLKNNRDRFIIFSPISTCKLLLKHNIKPNIVLHIDPKKEGTALLFEGLPKEYFDNTLALLSSNIDEKTVSRFPKENVFIISQSNEFKKGFGSLSAPTVGEYTYALNLLFGSKEIYLLGIDMAVDDETYATHSDAHPFAKQLDKEQDMKDTFVHKNSIFFVPGNFKERVPTMYGYQYSIDQFAYFTKVFKKSFQKVHNLSYGARLKDAIPTHAKEIETKKFTLISFSDINIKIAEELNLRSESKPNKKDIALIKSEVKETNKLLKYIKKHKNKTKTPIRYIDDLERLHTILAGKDLKSNTYLNQTMDNFFKIIYNYVFDIFNTLEVNASQKVLENIDAILIEQVTKIATFYKSKLEDYLK